MAWDSSRPVPWRRLVTEWAIYAGVMALIFALFFDAGPFSYVGLVVSLPLYLVFGSVLAKFGYSRKSLRQMRAESTATQQTRQRTPAATAPAVRERPAPTRRTSGGPNRRTSKQKRR